ncbi:ATP-binding cassette domain-containing protein [Aureimonas leprariae]|uniref:ATP-binding cassette domain-containing protein n=1 Tax=Plantimonas leprariae TaxID=2615207 RepID=A0A7V7PM61_9HYPH|nr:ATP-binding cassette domain-containing protein [Aureimonas leprariae]
MPLFELRGVSFQAAGRTILHPVDLTLETGRITGLIGPNGSGKSTLVKLLARQAVPAAGTIRFGGRDIGEGSARDFVRRLAYLPQFLPAADGMTVEEFVRLGRFPWHGTFGRFSDEDRAKVAAAMDACAVTGFRERLVDTLSGGERQRVALATMLAQDACCLVLDEPTSALDIAHQAEMLAMLGTIARERALSVVIVLHDINMAARLCDRLVALGGGRVVADAEPAGIMRPDVLMKIYGIGMRIFTPPEGGAPIGYVT